MPRISHLLIPLAILFAIAGNTHGGLYRWVDDEGNVHYTDSLPPTQINKGHTEITEGGVRVKTVPRAKTPEEILAERELERLRAEQERLIEEQRAADQVLLRTFRSEDDIVMARDGKLASIDVFIQVTKNNIRRLQERLTGLRTDAANLERAGKPVPQQLSDNIVATERSIGDAYGTILDREAKKDAIRDVFDRDLERFRELNDLTRSTALQEPPDSRLILHNIVACENAAQCDQLWSRAVAYARAHAITKVQADDDNILITAPPANENDIGLILSRIREKEGEGASLFLDLQCLGSPLGEQTCQGQKAQDILAGFRPAVIGEKSPNP